MRKTTSFHEFLNSAEIIELRERVQRENPEKRAEYKKTIRRIKIRIKAPTWAKV